MRRVPGTFYGRPDDPAGSGGETPAGWTPPENWPDQFADPNALLSSYNESRAAMNRLQAERDADREQFAAALSALETHTPPAQQQGPAFDPTLSAYTQAIEAGDYAAMLRIQNESAARPVIDAVSKLLDERMGQIQPVLEAQTAAQRKATIQMAETLAATELGPERYAQLLPSMRSLLDQHPGYLPTTGEVENYAAAILNVAKLAEHETLSKQVAGLEADRQEKLAAQTVTGAGRGSVYSVDEQKAEFERIKATPTSSYDSIVRGS